MNRLLKIAVLLVMAALTAGAPALLLAADQTAAPADKAATGDQPAAEGAKAPAGPSLLILAGAAFGAGLVTLGAGFGIGLIGSAPSKAWPASPRSPATSKPPC